MKILFRPALVGTAALIAALAPTSAAQLEGYDLTSGIPSDFFLVVGSRNVAEAQFIDDHWQGVSDAFEESEILDDLMDMLSEQDPDATAMVTGMFDHYSKLAAQVDWTSMGDQFIYGQRMNVPVFSGNTANVGPPDMVFLMRMDPEVAAQNYAGLLGLGQSALAQIAGMGGPEVMFETVEEKGFTFSVLDFTQVSQGAFDYPISFGYKEGVMAVTMGSGVRGEVTALLSGEGEIRSIASTERFKRAFKGMPDAKLGFEYFDMPNMRGSVQDIFEMVSGLLESELGPPPASGQEASLSEDQMVAGMVMHGMELANDAMSLIDYSSTVSFVRDHTVHSVSRAALASGVESNPFYPLIGTVKPVADFAKYLPESTSTYSVTGATDVNAIYDFMVELVKGFGPMGEMGVMEWEKLQQEMGFDMRRDVLSLIGGESISATFMVDGKEQWVTRMAVADEESAREKLDMGAAMVPELMAELQRENPMAGMLGLLVRESRDERFPGFHRVDVTMAGVSMLVGVQDGWMMFGSSGDALALTDQVAKGLAPNVRSNKELMRHAIIPEGPVQSASFNDYSGIAEEVSGMLIMASSMGGMFTSSIPNAKERQMANKLIGMVGRLAPVIAEIDFFESGSTIASFDGKAWTTHSVTNYAAPRKRAVVDGE